MISHTITIICHFGKHDYFVSMDVMLVEDDEHDVMINSGPTQTNIGIIHVALVFVTRCVI